jgi:Stage II sporulation protein E (SpoIIE)
MLVCVVLVAVLASQPALGDKDRGKIATATAAAATGGGAKPNAHARSGAADRRIPADQPAQDPTPPEDPPSTAMSVPPAPAPEVAPEPVEPAASAPEASVGPSEPMLAAPTPAPMPQEQSAPREPASSEVAARPLESRGGSQVQTPSDAQPEVILPARAPTSVGAASGPTPVGGPAAAPAAFENSQTAARSGDAALTASPGAGAGNAQRSSRARRLAGRSPGQSSAPAPPRGGRAIAPTAIADPLNTPATAAIAGDYVESSPGLEVSSPSGAPKAVSPLDKPRLSSDALVPRVIEALTPAAKIALIVLGLLVLLLGAHALVAGARTRRLQHQRERLMEDIGLLQAALLPAVPTRLGALLLTVAYRPADGPAAGGDFYDAFALPDGRVGLLLGDISGHGRQALAKTTLVRFTIRAHLEAGLCPREALAISGRSLDGRLSDDFATVIAAIHDPVKGTLTFASAGHPPPLVLGPSAHTPVTASSAPPIGAGFPTGQRQTVLPMPEGATVAVYSDGLLEARLAGKPLGSQRLTRWLAELGPEATATALLDLVVQRADRVPDDLAAVVLHAAPGAAAPAARIEQLKLDVLDVEGPNLDGFLEASGVSPADRAITGRRVSEQLSITGGVIVEVRTGEHPMVSVAPIGDETGIVARAGTRVL